MCPKSTVIQNRVGTAPFFGSKKMAKYLFRCQEYPSRCVGNEREIIPRLTKRFKQKILKEVFIHMVSESGLAIHLNNFEEQLPSGFGLAYLPGGGVIRLRLSVKGDEHADEMNKQANKLKTLLGDYLLAESDDPLQQILGNTLKDNGMTISLAESCSGGYIAHLLTNIAGSSAYFLGGVVSYSNSAKMNLLNVKQTTLDVHGAVSQETV